MEKRILIFALSLCLILHGIPVYAAEGAGAAVSRQGVESLEATEYVTMNGKAFLRAPEEAPAELPGVDVMWVNKANGVAYYSRTGNNGQYSIQIPQGTYLVQCTYGDQCETWEVNTNSEIPEEKITNVMFDRYPEPAGGYTVQGNVIELRGQPVAYAAVMLEEQNGGEKYVTLTDGSGNYRFNQVANGIYTFKIVKGRMRTQTNGWTINGSTNVGPIRISAVLSGQVIGLNGESVPGATVRLYAAHFQNGAYIQATADANGIYSFGNIGYGSYTLRAETHDGILSGSLQIDIDNGNSLMGDVDIQLNSGELPSGVIAGTVKKQDGALFSGGEVTVASTSDSTCHSAFLRSDGTYSVQNLLDGEYRITIHTGNCVASKVVTIQGGILTGSADFILSDCTLQGHIIRSDGVFQTGSIVTLTGTDGMVFESLPVSDSGQFSVVNLPEGQYQVTLTVPGQGAVNAGSVEIRDSQIHQADIVYSSTGGAGLVNSEMFTVAGGVSDGTGAVAGAAILVRDENGGEVAAAQTDNNGRYIIPNLPNGTYSICVATADGKTGQSTITILNGIITNGGGAIVVSPEGGGEITPPDGGGTTPPDEGETTPPDGGGTTPPDGGGTPPDGSVSGGDKDSNGNSPADNNNKPDGNQNPSEGGSSNGGSNPSEGGSPNGGGNPNEGGSPNGSSSQPGGGNTGAEGGSNAAANTAANGNAGKKISNSGVSGKEAVTVRGRVDAANAEVTIRDTANPDLVYSVKTDPQGFYRIEGLPDGTYKIMITASDGKEATAEFVVKNGESTLKAADFEGAVAVAEVEAFEGSGRTKSGSEPRTGDGLPPVVPVAMIGGLAYLMDLFCDKKGVRMGMKKAQKDWLIEKIVSRARGKAKPARILALSLIFVILVFYHSIGKIPEFDAGGLAHA